MHCYVDKFITYVIRKTSLSKGRDAVIEFLTTLWQLAKSLYQNVCQNLLHLGLNKLAHILQTTFWTAFCWHKCCSLIQIFVKSSSTFRWWYVSIGSGNSLMPNRQTCHSLNQWCSHSLMHICITSPQWVEPSFIYNECNHHWSPQEYHREKARIISPGHCVGLWATGAIKPCQIIPTVPQMWPSGLTLAMTLTLKFQG